MTTNHGPGFFISAKNLCIENGEVIKELLISCIDEQMMDLEDSLYRQIIDLNEKFPAAIHWDELEALAEQAKVLEQDIAVWLSMHGRSSYSLTWPKRDV